MKIYTAFTFEIDEPEEAAAEILAQLKPETNLQAHSLGILSCHADFVESGAAKAVCDALPFDVIGVTSMGSAVGADSGTDILTISVLTADDLSFSAVLTDPLDKDQETPLNAAYEKAAAALPGAPSLLIAMAPLLANVGGERLVRIMDKAAEGVPVFGTLTCDHNFDFRDAEVIFNGEHYRDRLAMALLSGPVKARFLTISIPEDQTRGQKALITESTGNVVRKVDGKPVLEYLSSIGLTRESGLAGSKNIPIILDYNDGTQPVARCFYMISPEGDAVCGGDMPMGATFALSTMESEDVLISAEQILAKMLAKPDITGMLIIPCIVRSVTLGVDQLAEARLVSETLHGKVPYQLCYSGGEICPVYQKDGATANRFHNFSFAVCMFEG